MDYEDQPSNGAISGVVIFDVTGLSGPDGLVTVTIFVDEPFADIACAVTDATVFRMNLRTYEEVPRN